MSPETLSLRAAANAAGISKGSSKRRCAAPLALLVALLLVGPPAHAAAAAIRPAEIAAMQEREEEILLVDVRAPQRFAQKHARGAISIPGYAVADKPLPRGQRIVVYDGGAGASDAEKAATALVATGFANVFVMEGGLTAWEAAQLPIVAEPGLTRIPFVEAIGPEELQALLQAGTRMVLLDTRPASEFRAGHLPGAIPATESVARAAAAPRSASRSDLVIVYDDGNGNAREQAEQLRRQGYLAVKYLYGGTRSWKKMVEAKVQSSGTSAP